MKKYIFNSFRRDTGANSYLPALDGIRFLAIFMVVIFHLFPSFKNIFGNLEPGIFRDLVQPFFLNGGRGVEIFFVLSAFILGHNAMVFKSKNGKNQPALQFYYKRFLRIYPPFLFAMILVFVGNVWITQQYSFYELLPSLITTLTYTNNIAQYVMTMPVLCMVTWTLEIEIQFYILFPFLRLIFNIPVLVRRILLLASIPLFTFVHIVIETLPTTLFSCFAYFLAGLFLADLHYNFKTELKYKDWICLLLSITCFTFIVYSDISKHFILYLYPYVIAGFFYFSFNSKYSLALLGSTVISVLGGMCYSIYLMHSSVISFLNTFLLKNHFAFNSWPWLWFSGNILAVLLASILFYLIAEKPFMTMRFRN